MSLDFVVFCARQRDSKGFCDRLQAKRSNMSKRQTEHVMFESLRLRIIELARDVTIMTYKNMKLNYFLVTLGLSIMFGPLVFEMLLPDHMYGAYLMITFTPGLIILAIGLIRSHKDKNNVRFLQPKNKLLGSDINPGVAILVLLFLSFSVGFLIDFLN
jgi:hypothetical protein